MTIEVRSLRRTVRLDLPDDGRRYWLLVPVGTSDVQALAWAAQGWPPRIVEALRARLATENPALLEGDQG